MGSSFYQRRLMATNPAQMMTKVKSNRAYVGDSHNNYTGDLTVLSMCVVPVRIQHEKSNKEVISFAMLDACSQGTFSTNKLLKDLGVEGTKEHISILRH